MITDAEKTARLKGADVFCAPSLRGESFGIVLLEAMAAGTAVVAGDLPGYRNVAEDGREALLVPPGDAESLAGALDRVLSDRSLASRLVQAGHARAESFSMSSLAERYLERYERIAVSARPVATRRAGSPIVAPNEVGLTRRAGSPITASSEVTIRPC